MQTRKVYYAERPDSVIVTAHGSKAVVELPVNISEVETEDGVQYLAEAVYYLATRNTPGLKERVEANYNAWLEVASEIEPEKATLDDAIEAINALTDLVLGGL